MPPLTAASTTPLRTIPSGSTLRAASARCWSIRDWIFWFVSVSVSMASCSGLTSNCTHIRSPVNSSRHSTTMVTDARERRLRSADKRTLTVHRTSSCFGDRTFAAASTGWVSEKSLTPHPTQYRPFHRLLPQEFGTVCYQTYKKHIYLSYSQT